MPVKILIDRIKSIFEYYKQSLVHKDIFDPLEDEYIINEYALSATACELDSDKDALRKLLDFEI